MEDNRQSGMKERYNAAVESFVDKVRVDPNVIAVIVCGSLAYDDVWEKSDIDMTMVVRDQQLATKAYCIIEDGITINVGLVVRSEFKRGMERMLGGSFGQSYYSRGKMVYTTDESLIEFFEELKTLGTDDMVRSVFTIGCEIVHLCDKCRKWLTVKKNPLYTQYYILKAADAVARMEICLHRESPGREAILRATELIPDMMTLLYKDAMSHPMSVEELEQALEQIDRYLEQHLELLKKPAVEFMEDQQLKTVTLIAKHFHTEGHFIVGIFDFLAEKGIIEKVSQTIRITPKSRLAVEEMGYLYIP